MLLAAAVLGRVVTNTGPALPGHYGSMVIGSVVIGSILTITGSWPPDRRRLPPNYPANDGQWGVDPVCRPSHGRR
ncbi:hypothetical protein ACFVDQ_32055 [Streptomyces sp. NPDC057684]|uniref:hypothetical protein n=1 Tax=Streptomyces sp. NPDC057684 TaxID=3346211 RepID=UPI00368CCB6E